MNDSFVYCWTDYLTNKLCVGIPNKRNIRQKNE
jgi:hypothetical protein